MVPCNSKHSGKLATQGSCIYLYMLMRLTEFLFPSAQKKFQQILFHSAPHECQVYKQVNDNKQTK